MKTNKKGVSLAFVIVVVLALVIFSSLLFSAAARSLSMTGESTEGREAYLRAKSAIEYAKTEVYSMAKSNRLAAFSVGPDGDSFRQIADRAADGTACLAECKPGSDGKTWTVTAKVKYRNSAQFRLLSYSFSFAFQNNPSVNGFIASGGSIGGSSYLNPGGEAANQPVYPILVQVPVYSTQGFTAPEMYFTDGYKLKGGGSSTENLTSNLVYLRGRINSDPGGQNATVSLHLCGIKDKDASSIQQKKGYAGIVWFHGASFQPRNSSAFASIPDGAYYFRDGANLFSEATLANLFDRNTQKGLFGDAQNADGTLQPVPQEDLQPSSGLTLGGKSLAGYAASAAYITDNAGRVKDGTSGDVNWMSETKFKTSYGNNCGVFDAGDADVSIYTDGGYKDDWQNCTSSLSYCARRIQLLKVDSSSLTFQIPNTSVTFQTGSFWFCEQSSQAYPWAAPPAGLPTDAPAVVSSSGVPTGVPKITASGKDSQLIFKSEDGTDVTLIFPRGLDIQPYNSDTTLLLPAGTYTLKSEKSDTSGASGTDLLGLPGYTQSNLADVLKPVSVGAHSGDAGPGGFTITPGKYSAP